MNNETEVRESDMMTPEEARQSADAIKRGMNNIRIQLLAFYEREGWKALGYGSWLECVKIEFGQSKAYLYRQLEAAQIEQRIEEAEKSPMGDLGKVGDVYSRKEFVTADDFKAICEAYSGDRFPEGKAIRKPFTHDGQLRTTTGCSNDYAETWRLINPNGYAGKPCSYAEMTAEYDKSRRRGDRTGELISFRGTQFVLVEPLLIRVKKEPIPERHLRPLASVPPAEQAGVYKLAKETAPEGKLTAKHVERTVREVQSGALKIYRIRDILTNEWWEGEAKTPEDACEAARGNSFGSSKAKWNPGECDIKEKTTNGAGGWKKVKAEAADTATKNVDCQGCPDHRGMINKHHGVKVPGNYGKCIRAGGLCEKAVAAVPGRDLNHEEYKRLLNSNPADLVQKIINLIDTITDDNPNCKAALAKIARHISNRLHKQTSASGITYYKEVI